MTDPYVYPGTHVLINSLDIREDEALRLAETWYTLLRLEELRETPLSGNYDFAHLCNYHKYIFQDIYNWAGAARTIPIFKSEKLIFYRSIDYEEPDKIKDSAEAVLKKLRETPWDKIPLEKQAKAFSEGLAGIWKVHSFREGNTRSCISFCFQFAREKGIIMDFKLFQQATAYVRNALVMYNANFDRGDFSNPDYLVKIVKDSMERGRKAMGMGHWEKQMEQKHHTGDTSVQEKSNKVKSPHREEI